MAADLFALGLAASALVALPVLMATTAYVVGAHLGWRRGLSEGIVRFAGVDLVDGTPVIDLKPYVTRFDRPAGEPRCGWFDQVTINDGITPEQLVPPRPPA